MPWMIYPETCFVPDETVIQWAKDAVANGDVEGPDPADLYEAMEILADIGDCTFASDKADPASLREQAQMEAIDHWMDHS
jgi:hypothetical protein